MSCSLCLAIDTEPAIYEDNYCKILSTKNLKGHKRRIMIATKEHVKQGDDYRLLTTLVEKGKEIFSYTYKFVIMDVTFASIKDHAHYVASDLDPTSNDYEQMLGTPWVAVVHVKFWTPP